MTARQSDSRTRKNTRTKSVERSIETSTLETEQTELPAIATFESQRLSKILPDSLDLEGCERRYAALDVNGRLAMIYYAAQTPAEKCAREAGRLHDLYQHALEGESLMALHAEHLGIPLEEYRQRLNFGRKSIQRLITKVRV